MLYNLLIHTWLALNCIPTFFCLYHFSIALAGLRKNRQNKTMEYFNHRFAVIIAARNEENVIVSLIESIQLQDYPEDLIDVIVVADNCDDKTAEIAESTGAIVYRRFNKVEVGKGFAVKFVLDKICEERDVYDAFCIIDADNVVDRGFIKEMNKSLCAGADVAQGYRDIKNPTDNWVAGCHALFFWMENRFYNYARSFLGLSANINGTAIMISDQYIKENGYNMHTMTEDIELTFQCAIHNIKIDWVPEAKVYDEQPLSIVQSMVQRTRWINGFFQCFGSYIKEFGESFFQKPSWVKLDVLMFALALPAAIIGAFTTVLYALLGFLRIFDSITVFFNFIILAAGSLIAFWFIGYFSVLFENKNKIKPMAAAILLYPFFNLTWIIIYVRCFFNRNVSWKPIPHGRNIRISDIESFKK